MHEPDLIELFVRPLARLQFRCVVTGSVASMLYGEPRVTHDIDLVGFLRAEDIPRLPEAYPLPEFYVSPAELMNQKVLSEWIRLRGVEAEWKKVLQ